jgi:hypothetical protein
MSNIFEMKQIMKRTCMHYTHTQKRDELNLQQAKPSACWVNSPFDRNGIGG